MQLRSWFLVAAAGLFACGDNGSSTPSDGRPPVDGVPIDVPPDADPCLSCSVGATCDPLVATPCSCPTGFAGDGTLAGTGCTDIDECAAANDCDELACANLAGTYQCEGAYAIEPFANILARLNPTTLALLDSSPITHATDAITGVVSMARHPVTGLMYAIVKTGAGREFGTLDLASAAFTSIAVVPKFSSMTFLPTGELYAITGRGGNPAKTLHTIDTATGVVTVLTDMAGGSDGAVICFNSDDNLMYYFVGSAGVMQSFALADPTMRTTVSPGIGVGEVFGCKYLGGGVFEVLDISSRIRHVTTAGVVSVIPDVVANLFQDVRAMSRAAMTPHTVRPQTGDIAGGETITVRGFGLTGATAVSFGAVPATSFVVVDDATITAVAPIGVAGIVDITVAPTTGFASTWRGAYTYIDPNPPAQTHPRQ